MPITSEARRQRNRTQDLEIARREVERFSCLYPSYKTTVDGIREFLSYRERRRGDEFSCSRVVGADTTLNPGSR